MAIKIVSRQYYLVAFIMAILAPGYLGAQIIISHATTIDQLELDASETLIVTDSKGDHYRQGRYKLEKVKTPDQAKHVDGYRIIDGQLIYEEGAVYSKFDLAFVPISLTNLGSRPILSSATDLWILDGNQPKRYYVPGLSFPSNIIDLKTQGSRITMPTQNRSLHVYDTLHQVLTYIGDEVTSAVIDKWDCLWYCDGQRLYQDTRFVSDEPPVLRSLGLVGQDQRPLERPIVLNTNENYFIKYQGEYSPLYHDITYAYKYDDQEWITLGSATSFRLAQLPPGRHEVYIRASGLEGTKSTVVQSVAFDIEGTDYAFLIKWGLGILLGLLGLSILGSFRTQTQLKQLAEEKKQIEWQLSLASEKQKLGQAQMQPHFLFNTLNGISGLIATKQLKEARLALQSFSKMMRTMLDGSREQMITVAEELQFLENYLKLEKMVRPDEFEYSIQVDLSADTKIPPMIIQPFIENAVIHGISGLNRKGTINVNLIEKGAYAIVTITDDGKGMAQAKAHKSSQHKSAAINIVEERLSLLDKWSSQSHITYEDLQNDNQKSIGTKVILQIPKL